MHAMDSWRHLCRGVTAGPARLNSSNAGVSLRARWDTGQMGNISSDCNGSRRVLRKTQRTAKAGIRLNTSR